MHVKDLIRQRLEEALAEAQRRGSIPQAPPPDEFVERPQNLSHGDFASSLPLKLARSLRMNPMRIAEALLPLIAQGEEIDRMDVAPPGFINFFLKPSWLRSQADTVLAAGTRLGEVDIGRGQKVQIEFVSVNPTGPIHVGHTRSAVLGSTLANVLRAAGYAVTREYYVNDAGSQMDLFYASLLARYRELLGQLAELPANGYVGRYLIDLAKEIVASEGDRFLSLSHEEAMKQLGALGLRKMLDAIREDLARIGVEFDVWFSEQSLFANSLYDKTVALLDQGGYLVQREGATWFTSPSLGDDKDSVMVRSSGAPTYFASDAAYHYNKFAVRGFHKVVNIWGADHQGHVNRVKAVVEALGIDPQRLHIIINQLVTLKRGGETVRASKRTGDLVTLRELVDEVGPDACRYFFLARSPESQMEFDLELAVRQSQENPVYYIQYAHARIAGILRNAKERGLDFRDGDAQLLVAPEEIDLLRKLLMLPELVETMAQRLEPHHLPHYTLELATAFHWFYDQCRVITEDEALTRARLKLVETTRIVLAKCLDLMGMK
ncbi:MAG: arginine--tRNA ligase, partial [Chloroflexi bacterium]|nr:arginine--tRNA ligase [Chloroflexota bacterium]